MRKIKFRAKSIKDKSWVYGYLFIDISSDIDRYFLITEKAEYCDITEFIDGTEDKIIEVIPETVGQFTGLYDKNGKEIYEKDIVKQGSVLGKVFFEDGCFWVEWENEDEPHQLYWVNDEIEVVGNVCDNPEMLKK